MTTIGHLWQTNHRVRFGLTCAVLGLGGLVAVIIGLIMLPALWTLPSWVYDLLATIFAGLLAIGSGLTFHEWSRTHLLRQKLLLETTADEEVLPPDTPDSPTGYGPPQAPEVAISWHQYFLWMSALIPLIWISTIVEDTIRQVVQPIPPLPNGMIEHGLVFGMLAVMVLVHEAVHAGSAVLLGYAKSVTVGHDLPFIVYIELQDVLLRRHEYLLILGAPLVLVTTAFIGLGLIVDGWLVRLAFQAAALNIWVAMGDVYQLLTVLQRPPETRFYHGNEGPLVVYEPKQPTSPLLVKIENHIAQLVGPAPTSTP